MERRALPQRGRRRRGSRPRRLGRRSSPIEPARRSPACSPSCSSWPAPTSRSPSYNLLALDPRRAACSPTARTPRCQTGGRLPDPGDRRAERQPASRVAHPAPSQSARRRAVPDRSGATGTPAPTLPPWDGKERLNVLLVGVDQRQGDVVLQHRHADRRVRSTPRPRRSRCSRCRATRSTCRCRPTRGSVWGSVYRGKINSWYAANRNRTDLWPGKTARARGFNALKALLGELYGLDIRYYVMVNFQGFRKVVNAMGGVHINVQIPVAESDYPVAGGVTRIYIPAGPQHMTRRRGAALRAVATPGAWAATSTAAGASSGCCSAARADERPSRSSPTSPALVGALKESVKTDIPSQMPKLLALAESVDTKNIRSFVFSPFFYAPEFDRAHPRLHHQAQRLADPQGGQAGVQDARPTCSPAASASGAEARAGVGPQRLGRGRALGSTSDRPRVRRPQRLGAQQRRRRPARRRRRSSSTTGRRPTCPETIKYLEHLFHTKVTTATDPRCTVDMIITLGGRPEPHDRPRRLTAAAARTASAVRGASRPPSGRARRGATAGRSAHP